MIETFVAGVTGGLVALGCDRLLRWRRERRMKRVFFDALEAGRPTGYAPILEPGEEQGP